MPKRNPLKRKPPKEGRLQKQKQKQYVRQNVVVNLQQPQVKRTRRRTTNIRKNFAEQGSRSTSSAITNVYTTLPPPSVRMSSSTAPPIPSMNMPSAPPSATYTPYTNMPSRDEVLREVRAEVAEGNRLAAMDAQRRAMRTLQQEEVNSANYRSGEAAPSPMRNMLSIMPQPPFEDVSPPLVEEELYTPNALKSLRQNAELPPDVYGGADVATAPENPLPSASERKRRGPKTDAEKADALGMSLAEYRATKSTKKAQREAQPYDDLGESASQIGTPPRPEGPSLFELATGMSSLKKRNPLAGGGGSVASSGTSARPTFLQQIAEGGTKLKKTSPLAERKRAGKTPSEVSTSMGSGFNAMANNPLFKMRQRQAEEEDDKTIWE